MAGGLMGWFIFGEIGAALLLTFGAARARKYDAERRATGDEFGRIAYPLMGTALVVLMGPAGFGIGVSCALNVLANHAGKK